MGAVLARVRREYAGVIVGSLLMFAGVLVLAPFARSLPKDLAWLLIGAGLGAMVTDMLAAADRKRAEQRHKLQLSMTLGALSGSPAQVLRFGTALASMVTDPNWPLADERRFLVASAPVFGISELLNRVVNDKELRTGATVEDFVLYTRAKRGKFVAEALKIGYRLERMAIALQNTSNISNEEIAEHERALVYVKKKMARSFPLDAPFQAWFDRNLDLDHVLPENRVAVLRQALKMLWQSSHLRLDLVGCECLDRPLCKNRSRYLHFIKTFPDARQAVLSVDCSETLASYEIRQRGDELTELTTF